jgi:hypothetical protein
MNESPSFRDFRACLSNTMEKLLVIVLDFFPSRIVDIFNAENQ